MWADSSARRPSWRYLIDNFGLPAWFALMTAVHLATTSTTQEMIGLDARIYYRGADAWIHGGDPWSAVARMAGGHFHFAGAPPTVELLGPFTLIPESAFVVLAIASSLVAAVYILRKLHLPGTWLLFPAVVQALLSANPQLVVLALLLASWPALSAVAAVLKIYAVIPVAIEMRWKAVVATIGLLAASVLVAPGLWGEYISRFAAIGDRLNSEAAGGFSGWGLPLPSFLAVVAAIGVLALLDRRSAAWLAVPALWPASQLHYSAFALPVITPLMAFVLAIPQPGIPAAAAVALACWRLYTYIRRRRPATLPPLLRRRAGQ